MSSSVAGTNNPSSAKCRRARASSAASYTLTWRPCFSSAGASLPDSEPPPSVICRTFRGHARFSGFNPTSSDSTNSPSFRTSTPSNQISPPPHSGVWMSTRSQWTALRFPLSHISS